MKLGIVNYPCFFTDVFKEFIVKTVLTYGTFDLFHIGHLNILERARNLGDRLIVALSTDEFNHTYKNKQTVICYNDRKRILESLRCVDLVIPENSWEQKKHDVINHNVDIFAMGNDWEGHFDFLKEHCDVIYFPRTKDISSSELKQHIKNSPNKLYAAFKC